MTLAYCANVAVMMLAVPAHAQNVGKGAAGVDETSDVPRCAQSLGTVALVEGKAGCCATVPSVSIAQGGR